MRERIRKSLWKEFWKFQYNETNLGSVFQVKNMYAFMEEILLWHLKLVSTIFSYAIKIKLLKNYQKCFFFTKKYPFVLEIIKFLYFILSYVLHYDIFISLNWILKTQIL